MAEQRRVRVTSSRAAAPRRRHRPVAAELSEHTELGEIYLRGLMSAQLRLSLSVLALGGVILGGLPLLFAFVPSIAATTIAGIGLPWWLLGLLVYPAAYGASRFYLCASARIEQQFADAVAGTAPPPS